MGKDCGCPGKKKQQTSSYYASYQTQAAPIVAPTKVRCEITYSDLVALLNKLNILDMDTTQKNTIRFELATMVQSIRTVCPDAAKIESIKKTLYGSDSL